MTVKLGKLEKVDLRTVWENEATDFTPWLGTEENISILSATVGIDLEVEAQEKSVGAFSADILCKDTGTGSWVLIENQLEKTDHTHLGQILTYAAGLNTQTVIWVASRIRDEHRAAMDWLNDNTNDDFHFFALEVELWQIGDSAIAPKFNVVCKPNDWTKSLTQRAKAAERTALTEIQKLQLEFWNGFREFVENQDSPFRPQKALPQHWINISSGRTGFKYNAIASFWDNESKSNEKHEIRAEMEIYDTNAEVFFNALRLENDQIEREMGESLIWYEKEGVNARRIFVRKTADLNQPELWPSYFVWLTEKITKLREVFGSRIKAL